MRCSFLHLVSGGNKPMSNEAFIQYKGLIGRGPMWSCFCSGDRCRDEFMRSELCALGLLHLVLYSCCHCSVPRPNSFPPGLPRTECWDILYFYRPASYDFLYVLFSLISTCTCGFANSVLSRTECKCIHQFLSRLCWIKNNLKTLSTQI